MTLTSSARMSHRRLAEDNHLPHAIMMPAVPQSPASFRPGSYVRASAPAYRAGW
jgi:hypothetical protein